jgi:signal transduction histidine kinase
LDFRQTEIKGFSLSFIKANISELVEETYLSFKPLAEEKNIHFTISLPQVKQYAYIDIEAFNKILTNLLSNAVKYAKSRVHLSLFPSGEDFFKVEIRNDGFIIPYDMKDKIFEPFFRLKETEKQKGTGIGLALSRSLTQLHKGILELEKTDGEMNIFSLQMPVQQDMNTAPITANDTVTTQVTIINQDPVANKDATVIKES